jgi:hypothetical protein
MSEALPIRSYDLKAIASLADDLVVDFQHNPNQWENATLDRFLEAFAAWLSDNNGYWQNVGREVPDNPWEIIWHALKAAPSYE